jgi:hypothetical protein
MSYLPSSAPLTHPTFPRNVSQIPYSGTSAPGNFHANVTHLSHAHPHYSASNPHQFPHSYSPTAPLGPCDLWTHPILPHSDHGAQHLLNQTLTNSYPHGSGYSYPIQVDPSHPTHYPGLPFAARSTFPYSNTPAPTLNQHLDAPYSPLSQSSASSSYPIDHSLPFSHTTYVTEEDRYHIPGYSGFIRGKQFTHGHTYGRTTKICLGVPNNEPINF